MPQIFNVLKCFKCLTYQVQQQKKTNKWSCKICYEKQSVKQIFGSGSGYDCRQHVQKLNMMKGQLDNKLDDNEEEQDEDEKYNDEDDDYDYDDNDNGNDEGNLTNFHKQIGRKNTLNDQKNSSKWGKFITETSKYSSSENEDDICKIDSFNQPVYKSGGSNIYNGNNFNKDYNKPRNRKTKSGNIHMKREETTPYKKWGKFMNENCNGSDDALENLYNIENMDDRNTCKNFNNNNNNINNNINISNCNNINNNNANNTTTTNNNKRNSEYYASTLNIKKPKNDSDEIYRLENNPFQIETDLNLEWF